MKKTKLPSIISVLILTLITVVMWVSLDIYRALKKPTEITVSKEISQQLNPSLDQESIKKVESRSFLDDSQIPNISISPGAATPSSTIAPVIIPTTETVTQTVDASNSGTTQ